MGHSPESAAVTARDCEQTCGDLLRSFRPTQKSDVLGGSTDEQRSYKTRAGRSASGFAATHWAATEESRSSVFGDASSAACVREMADNADATPVSRRIFKFIMFQFTRAGVAKARRLQPRKERREWRRLSTSRARLRRPPEKATTRTIVRTVAWR